jgi:hypothetical protein
MIKPVIKRKVGYNVSDDEVAKTRNKMSRMDVKDD